MTDLSLQAQKVLNAYRTSHTGPGCLAAALRAAADQLVLVQWDGRIEPAAPHSLGVNFSCDALHALANELEAQSTSNDRQIRSSDITPPPELVLQWLEEAANTPTECYSQTLATRAAQWGADRELEECCVLMDDWGLDAEDLKCVRRPKRPSLKEQALAALERYEAEEWCEEMTFDSEIIRRALEQLDD